MPYFLYYIFLIYIIHVFVCNVFYTLPYLTLPSGIGLLGYEACCARSHRALDFVLYSVLVGYGIPDLSPVLIQPSLEGIDY